MSQTWSTEEQAALAAVRAALATLAARVGRLREAPALRTNGPLAKRQDARLRILADRITAGVHYADRLLRTGDAPWPQEEAFWLPRTPARSPTKGG